MSTADYSPPTHEHAPGAGAYMESDKPRATHGEPFAGEFGSGHGDDDEPGWVKHRELEHPYPDETGAALELPAAGESSEPARPVEAAENVEGLTITDAASAYGVSVSTLRRRIAKGEIAGAVKVPGPKGVEYRVPAESLEALGYKAKESRAAEAVKAARSGLEAEQLEGRVRELEASLELERLRREAAETEAELLRGNVEDLRSALAKLPAALPAGESRRRWFRKGSK